MPTIGLSKPRQQKVGSPLNVGDSAPDLSGRNLEDVTTFIAFLRHTGCPFAEQTVKELREDAALNSEVQAVVVTHGDEAVARQWLDEIGGMEGLIWVHDPNRELYGNWGIGYSGLKHMINFGVIGAVRRLRKQGITNRDASGTRWQRSAWFLVRDGKIAWKSEPATAHNVPRLPEALANAG